MCQISKYRQTITLTISNVLLFIVFVALSRLDSTIPFYFSAWKYETGLFAPYQLFTYQFIHADLSHLFFNLLVLIPVSIHLESFIKSPKLIYYFFVSGIISGLFHLFFYQSNLPLVGASGSIWGLTILYALTCKSSFLRWVILISFSIEIWKSISGQVDGVAHLCHVGGAISGFLIYLFDKKLFENNKQL